MRASCGLGAPEPRQGPQVGIAHSALCALLGEQLPPHSPDGVVGDLEPLRTAEDGTIPGPLLAEITALHASNRDFYALSGDFPDANDIRPEQVAGALSVELANPDVEILLARDGEGGDRDGADGDEDGEGGGDGRHGDGGGGGGGRRLVGVAITLSRHPDPADPDPWIGLLLVDAGAQRRGYGRQLASLVEERFRLAGRTAVRLAALDNNPGALAFWTSLGYEVVEHRRDRQLGRPCTVLRKTLRRQRRAARVAVLDPEGAVLLFKYHNDEVGVHWALPGGGLEAAETPREGARRELREETGWTDLEPGAFLCTWSHDFTRADAPVRQHDDIYVARGPRREPVGGLLAASRAEEGILAWRWWTRAELVAQAEPVWPPELARLLAEFEAAAEAENPPAPPADLTEAENPPAPPADLTEPGRA
ncbi:bifunctional GNAT family N-acetyltransferase/NUDIX hydrolase [Streptomyces sp. NBC_00481]|uniref:bifunctional GNAT family N-acetyltransferase/NUDIX hydrolase n=1 Tax=Streptomyces sp. NBC_00481 TaxID=2975755 RepID=UPI002DD93C0E|nr:bifunctional GNAT family N-acetyltransferase/NUDIX hydrolase [Streptomyces sp. NBC_00481]WRY97529.1 bifunctional GNAT family N-acetyltransferase/NUDIX hydrolase [Streptomyces sp. NBC_00481]